MAQLHLDYLVVEAGEVLVHDVLLQDVLEGAQGHYSQHLEEEAKWRIAGCKRY